MGKYLLMPKLDMSMKEGTIVSWLVGKGDEVKKGENVFEVETGKVSIEVDNTACEGEVLGIYYDEGDTVLVNTPVMYIGSPGETAPDKDESLEYFRQLKKENADFIEPHGYDYDVIIIGSGQAGYTFAVNASRYTDSIAVIEKKDFGGVCLNRGCIPSRFFNKRAELIMKLSDTDRYDISSPVYDFDYRQSAGKKNELVGKLRSSVKHTLTGSTDVYEDHARILAPNIVSVGSEIISGKYIVIASGSHGISSGIPSDESVMYLSPEDVLCLDELPGSAVFFGESEYVIEQAVMYSLFGVNVTLIGKLTPTDDDYINRQIRRAVQKRKIPVIDDEVCGVKDGYVLLKNNDAVKADILVCENRRKANIVPSEIKFELTGDGFYACDEYYRTNVEGVYVIGDANGLSMTAQGAGKDGEDLAVMLFTGEVPAGKICPRCINIYPQIVYAGYSESALEKMGIKCVSARRSLSSLPAAMASSSGGFVRIVCDAVYGEILGFQIMSDDADELAGALCLAMNNELTAEELSGSIFVHPSLGEIIAAVCREICEKTERTAGV